MWVMTRQYWRRLPSERYSEAIYPEGISMKRSLVFSLALFCFAAIAAIVMQSSRASPSVRSVEPVKEAQASNVEVAKRFAGTWKGKSRPEDMAQTKFRATVKIDSPQF